MSLDDITERAADLELGNAEIRRYGRHLTLPQVGVEGQKRLKASRVLLVGVGGLGSPLGLYLAAAGVGTLGVIDDDLVDLSNLQRQIVHDSSAIDQPKVASAQARLKEINPEVQVVPYQERLSVGNAMALFAGYDLVADGSDNFATRYLVNDACYLAGKTLVSAAIMRFDGQLSTYKAYARDAAGPDQHPCYRCLFGAQPGEMKESCADVGVLGALAGTMGSLQATEVVKELLGIGESLSGHLVIYDALGTTFHKVRAKADPGCPLCGKAATITDLGAVDYRLDESYCAA